MARHGVSGADSAGLALELGYDGALPIRAGLPPGRPMARVLCNSLFNPRYSAGVGAAAAAATAVGALAATSASLMSSLPVPRALARIDLRAERKASACHSSGSRSTTLVSPCSLNGLISASCATTACRSRPQVLQSSASRQGDAASIGSSDYLVGYAAGLARRSLPRRPPRFPATRVSVT